MQAQVLYKCQPVTEKPLVLTDLDTEQDRMKAKRNGVNIYLVRSDTTPKDILNVLKKFEK